MSTPTAAPPEPPQKKSKAGRIAVIAVVVCLAVFWAYVFFWPRKAEDKLVDRAWAEQANTVCKQWQDKLQALPAALTFANVEPKEEALRQRADVGEQATGYLRSMVEGLRALPTPTDPAGAEKVDLWLKDWDAYLNARDAHVQEWRDGQDVRFKEPPVEAGEIAPISLRMDAFAATNLMVACEVPQDFG